MSGDSKEGKQVGYVTTNFGFDWVREEPVVQQVVEKSQAKGEDEQDSLVAQAIMTVFNG